METITSKVIVYGYFNYTKQVKGEEQGLICINYLIPKEETATVKGYTTGLSWIPFTDEVWKSLESILLKSATLTFKLVEDYKDSNKLSKVLIKINDIDIKQ